MKEEGSQGKEVKEGRKEGSEGRKNGRIPCHAREKVRRKEGRKMKEGEGRKVKEER